jgi:hypothetical protein
MRHKTVGVCSICRPLKRIGSPQFAPKDGRVPERSVMAAPGGLMTDKATSNSARPRPSANQYTARRRETGDQRALVPVSRPGPPAISSSRTPAKAAVAHEAAPRTSIFPKLFTVAVLVALWVGWINRDDDGLTPVSGAGYWLGIVGSSLMLLLLLYPLRKRFRSLQAIGSVTFWFNTHMILGVLGPVLVMWHANFKLGSINCSVALVTMLVVAVSGVVGRFLHRKVNLHLYGRKAQAQEVLADADELRGFLGSDGTVADSMVAQLNAFAQVATYGPRGVLAALVLLPLVNWRGSIVRIRLIARARRVIAVEGQRRGRSQKVQRQQLAGVTDFVTQHVGAAKKAATFAVYERLFRLWHVFHLPLFFLLVIVAIVHVYASHFF